MSIFKMIMFTLLLLIYFVCSCLSDERSYFDVETCDSHRCQLPYCYCSNQTIPAGLMTRDTPQFIAITINGPIDENSYGLLREIFFSKKYYNPDGLFVYLTNMSVFSKRFVLGYPISGTIFLKSHVETDYCLLRQVLRYENIELSITSNSSE